MHLDAEATYMSVSLNDEFREYVNQSNSMFGPNQIQVIVSRVYIGNKNNIKNVRNEKVIVSG